MILINVNEMMTDVYTAGAAALSVALLVSGTVLITYLVTKIISGENINGSTPEQKTSSGGRLITYKGSSAEFEKINYFTDEEVKDMRRYR